MQLSRRLVFLPILLALNKQQISQIFTACIRSKRKVMFSQASVCPQVGLSTEGGFCLKGRGVCMECADPTHPHDPIRQGRPTSARQVRTPRNTVNRRAVRILLKCILVSDYSSLQLSPSSQKFLAQNPKACTLSPSFITWRK